MENPSLSQSDWADQVLTFWFEGLEPKQHFQSTPEQDAEISKRFAMLLDEVAARPDIEKNANAKGQLAAIIVLDQFSRNIHRGKAEAFAHDDLAASLARSAIERGFDQQVSKDRRSFFYMPLMHAENLAHQDFAVALFDAKDDAKSLKSAKEHRDLIAKFGRFPHRNAALGRTDTPEETEYLKTAKRYGQ